MIVRFTRRAHSDLTEILDYIDMRSPRGAMSVKLAIKRAIDMIGDNPGVGRLTGKGAIRGMPVGRYPYLIYWTVEGNEIWIVHIRHGARMPWRE